MNIEIRKVREVERAPRAGWIRIPLAACAFMCISLPPAFTQIGTDPPKPVVADNPAQSNRAEDMPGWMRRGLPGVGHAALKPLVGTWRARYEVYGTLGRRGDEPPIVSDDVTTRREWIGGGRFIEDTTEGTLMGAPLWRRGWLGYSNADRRYEWVTIDSVNPTMMIYRGPPGSATAQPIVMDGAFTDQGVAGEGTVGKRVGMRTVIRVETDDRHMFELYFSRPGEKEVLALRTICVRMPR